MNQPLATERHVVVLNVPRAIEIQIEDRFLDRAGLTRPEMGYHITLVGPFYMQTSVKPHLMAELEAVARHAQPFPIRISGLDVFERPTGATLYLAVVVDQAIREFKASIAMRLEPHVDFTSPTVSEWNLLRNFHPHITLGIDLSEAELLAFRRTLEPPPDLGFTAQEIALVTQSALGPWKTQATYLLGGAAPDNTSHSDY